MLLICLAFVWGIHWPVAKIGLRDLPPFTYGTLRVATGLVVVVGVLAARRGLRLPSRHDVPVVLSVGIGQMAAGIALMNFALPLISAGRSSILVYTMPLWWRLSSSLPCAPVALDGRWPGCWWVLAGVRRPAQPGGHRLGLFRSAARKRRSPRERGPVGRHHDPSAAPSVACDSARPHAVAALGCVSTAGDRGADPGVGPPDSLGADCHAAVLYSGPLATALAFLAEPVHLALSEPLATTMGFLAVPSWASPRRGSCSESR